HAPPRRPCDRPWSGLAFAATLQSPFSCRPCRSCMPVWWRRGSSVLILINSRVNRDAILRTVRKKAYASAGRQRCPGSTGLIRRTAMRLFALQGTHILGQAVAQAMKMELDPIEEREFPDWEHKSHPLIS